MECIEIENSVQNLVDEGSDPFEDKEIKAHLAICKSCAEETRLLISVREILKRQPEIIPAMAFDERVLNDFMRRKAFVSEKTTAKSPFAKVFDIPRPVFAAGIAALLLFSALSFALGRISVSSPPQISRSLNENPMVERKPIETPQMKKEEPVIVQTEPEIKTVVKYVEVPVVKERIIEKKIFVEKESKLKPENPKRQIPVEEKNNAAQFNLKYMQPVAKVSYKIIRKGEKDEK